MKAYSRVLNGEIEARRLFWGSHLSGRQHRHVQTIERTHLRATIFRLERGQYRVKGEKVFETTVDLDTALAASGYDPMLWRTCRCIVEPSYRLEDLELPVVHFELDISFVRGSFDLRGCRGPLTEAEFHEFGRIVREREFERISNQARNYGGPRARVRGWTKLAQQSRSAVFVTMNRAPAMPLAMSL